MTIRGRAASFDPSLCESGPALSFAGMLHAGCQSSPRWPATLILKQKPRKHRAFPYCLEVHIGRLGGFCFQINGAFGDLTECGIGLLFFRESLIEQSHGVVQSEFPGPRFVRAGGVGRPSDISKASSAEHPPSMGSRRSPRALIGSRGTCYKAREAAC